MRVLIYVFVIFHGISYKDTQYLYRTYNYDYDVECLSFLEPSKTS